MRALNSMLIHKIAQIERKLFQRKRRAAPRRLPMPARINGNHAKMLRKRRNLMNEIRSILAVSMQQNQRLARSGLRIRKTNVHARPPFAIQW